MAMYLGFRNVLYAEGAKNQILNATKTLKKSVH